MTSSPLDAATGFDTSGLKEKSVIITGGAGGLGEGFVRGFVKAGAFVTVGDMSEERGKSLVSELGSDKVAFVKCNVCIWSDQVALFKSAIAHSPHKAVDIVVANAGTARGDTVALDDAETDGEPIEPKLTILETNLTGVVYTAKLALHYFSRQPSDSFDHDRCLIMTSSIAGFSDGKGRPQYAASKWGVRGLMRSFRRSGPATGMRTNMIAPWYIETNIMTPEGLAKLTENGVSLAKIEDAVAAVLHLASDRSVNGRAVAVLPRGEAELGYRDIGDDDNIRGLLSR